MAARNCFWKLLALLLLTAGLIGHTAADNRPIRGQAVIRLYHPADASRAFRGVGVTVHDSIPGLGLYLVSFSPDASFEQKRAALMRRPGVRDVHPNSAVRLVHPFQSNVNFPDDDAPVFVSGEQPASYYGQPTVLSIGLDSAHTLSEGVGVTIAVIDNGVDRAHPLFDSLSPTILYDLVDGDNNPAEVTGPAYGHGTFTAGLIRLAAPGADLMIIRAFDSSGVATVFTISQAVDWAVAHGADIINMSFGMTSNNGVLELACDRAVDSGVTLVAAVGNSGSSVPVYPAAYPGVIAVGALDTLDLIASFSNGYATDLCAPGVSLYSALPDPWFWGTWSGTSFSAALVSATAGLVLALDPSILPLAMESHLRSTATTNLAWGTVIPPDPYYGYGRVDACAAVANLQPMPVARAGAPFTVADLRLIVDIVAFGRAPDRAMLSRLDLNHNGLIDPPDLDLAIKLLFDRAQDTDPYLSSPQR